VCELGVPVDPHDLTMTIEPWEFAIEGFEIDIPVQSGDTASIAISRWPTCRSG